MQTAQQATWRARIRAGGVSLWAHRNRRGHWAAGAYWDPRKVSRGAVEVVRGLTVMVGAAGLVSLLALWVR